jgi:hypothetical protein
MRLKNNIYAPVRVQSKNRYGSATAHLPRFVRQTRRKVQQNRSSAIQVSARRTFVGA